MQLFLYPMRLSSLFTGTCRFASADDKPASVFQKSGYYFWSVQNVVVLRDTHSTTGTQPLRSLSCGTGANDIYDCSFPH